MPRASKTQLALLLFATSARTVQGVTPQGHAIMEAMQTEEHDMAHKHPSGYVPLEDSCGGKCRLVARETSAIAIRPGGHVQKVKRSSLAQTNGSAAALEGGCRPGDGIWEKDAGGHSCGARIEWVVRHTDADTYDKAKELVASQFLEICAPCKPVPGRAPAPRISHTDVCGGELANVPYHDANVWGTAFVGWEDCAGTQQSPIDICTQAASICPQNRYNQSSSPLGAHYVPSAVTTLQNNGHNLEVVNAANDFGTLRLQEKVFTAQGAHFHTPAEHTVDGKAGPMEMHIVHKAADGALAVVGILFELGNESECLKPLPLGPEVLRSGCHRDSGAVDLACFDEQLSGPWWSYRGSLTTPPCTEGLSWVVMVKRATMSQQQLDGFTSAHQMNARPVQANRNTVTLNTPAPP